MLTAHLKTGFSQRKTPLKAKSLAGEQVLIFYYIYLSIYLWGCAKVVTCMYGRDQEGRGQFAVVGFLLLQCGLQGLNSSCQAWRQAPLQGELSF